MTIYIYNGLTSKKSQVFKTDSDFDFIATYDPKKVTVTADNKKRIKAQADYFYSGTIDNIEDRGQAKIESKNLLVLDIDDIPNHLHTESMFVDFIHNNFYDVNYILYPTISCNVKNLRYRLIIETDRAFNEEEQRKMVLLNFYRLSFDKFDHSNLTWKQLQGLPIHVENSGLQRKYPIVNNVSALLSLEDVLSLFEDQKFKETLDKFFNLKNEKHGTGTITNIASSKRYKSTFTELLESLIDGAENGERNIQVTKISGKLLAYGVAPSKAFQLVQFYNNNSDEPLSQNEIEGIFLNILRKEVADNDR